MGCRRCIGVAYAVRYSGEWLKIAKFGTAAATQAATV